MTIVGFDFGTTNSLISFVRGDKTINCLDEERRPIPSVVCYEGTKTLVGREARDRLSHAGLGIYGNIVRSPKMQLGKDGIFVDGIERNPVDIVADVVRHVLDEATHGRYRREIGQVSHAVVTIPVDMQGYQRRALRDAFRSAGLGIVQFVHEPLAALYGYFRGQGLAEMLRRHDRKLALVFDWGGGTLDLTLCRIMDGMAVQIMNDGTDEVGGDVFDDSTMNQLLTNVSSANGAAESPDANPGAKQRLLHKCELAKIELSERARAQIFVPGYFRGAREGDFDYTLDRNELEAIITPLLDKGFRRIEKILTDAGYAPEQVALCLATGGMANVPAVKRRLHERFGVERVRIPDSAATLIAEGAAWIAHDKADLRLAKSVELILARNSFLPLVKAGTAMPREGGVQKEPFHLYCTDPRDGVAKMQICTPKRPGNAVLPSEPRTVLNILTVKVDEKARAFHERLELDIKIDDDLVLTADARSLNKKDQDQREIHNLEFGLAFPVSDPLDNEDTGEEPEVRNDDAGIEPRNDAEAASTLTVRANVAYREDLFLVPGEFLYTYNSVYFDVRCYPPKIQEDEKMYYETCSHCRRAANDPLCKCSTIPPPDELVIKRTIRPENRGDME